MAKRRVLYVLRKVVLRIVRRVMVVRSGEVEERGGMVFAGTLERLDGHGRSHNISAECCVSSSGARVGICCLPSRLGKESQVSEKGLS